MSQSLAWLEPAAGQLVSLLDLPSGWDSYQAVPIMARTANRALRLLGFVMTAQTPAPAIVPVSTGAIQLEWHCRGYDIEVVVSLDGDIEVWYADLERLVERELSGSEAVDTLRSVLQTLTAKA